jgi:hypothetical protein
MVNVFFGKTVRWHFKAEWYTVPPGSTMKLNFYVFRILRALHSGYFRKGHELNCVCNWNRLCSLWGAHWVLCNLVSCFTSKACLISHNVLSLTDKNSSDFVAWTRHYLWADIAEKTHRCCQKRRFLFLHAPLRTCRCLLGVQFVTRHVCNQIEYDNSNTISRQAQDTTALECSVVLLEYVVFWS